MSRSLTPFIAALATWPARQAARSNIQSMQSLWSSAEYSRLKGRKLEGIDPVKPLAVYAPLS
jgi:hypothetical protein